VWRCGRADHPVVLSPSCTGRGESPGASTGNTSRTMRKRGTPIVRHGPEHCCAPTQYAAIGASAASLPKLTVTLVPPRTCRTAVSPLAPRFQITLRSGRACASVQRRLTIGIRPSKFVADVATAPIWRRKRDHVSYIFCNRSSWLLKKHYALNCVNCAEGPIDMGNCDIPARKVPSNCRRTIPTHGGRFSEAGEGG
jgi:hypothetical protein